jgi:hypothetical protein
VQSTIDESACFHSNILRPVWIDSYSLSRNGGGDRAQTTKTDHSWSRAVELSHIGNERLRSPQPRRNSFDFRVWRNHRILFVSERSKGGFWGTSGAGKLLDEKRGNSTEVKGYKGFTYNFTPLTPGVYLIYANWRTTDIESDFTSFPAVLVVRPKG